MHDMASKKRFFSEGCPPHFIGVCPNKIYRRVVHNIIGVCPNKMYRRLVHNIIGVCPNKKKISEGGPTFYQSLSKLTFARTKTKTFCFRNDFHTWQNACVGKSVRTRGMVFGI